MAQVAGGLSFDDLIPSVLAGNSRVACDASGHITIEGQIQAFKAAMSFARSISDRGLPVSISLALDHRGIFRKQFLRDGLTNSAKRNPNLAQLKSEIVDVFAPLANEQGVRPESISIIHEDSARTHASHVANSGQCLERLARWMTVRDHDEDEDQQEGSSCGVSSGGCSYGPRDVDRVTCAAVTAEYFAKALTNQGGAQRLEVFFEDDPWSRVPVFIRGAVLLEAAGSLSPVRLNLVHKNGRVISPRRNSLPKVA